MQGEKEYKVPSGFREGVGIKHGVDILVLRKDGTVKFELYKGDLGDRPDRDPEGDVITQEGIASIAALILNDVAQEDYDWIAIGTGTTAASSTQTALVNETHREAGTGSRVTTVITNDTAQLVSTFSGYGGTESIAEIGVFNAASGGTMLFRQTFTPLPLDWDAGDTFVATCKVRVS